MTFSLTVDSLPRPRGPVSETVIRALRRPPPSMGLDGGLDAEVGNDEDEALALYVCYELHYHGFAGVDDAWEWDPGLLGLRGRLERRMLDALQARIGPPAPVVGGDIEPTLAAIVSSGAGPSLSGYMATEGTLRQFQEFAVHRSAYQLKEADPHTWGIPRLTGVAKAAMVSIQHDEYGQGDPAAVHAEVFARTMTALGLDPSYGAYLDVIPAATLRTVNLVSLFGLHRRWRGALVGHLAVFEMASVTPNARYAQALRRLGLGVEATRFYDVQVQADAVHERIALHDLAGGLAAAQPDLAGDIIFGARAIMATEADFARHLLDSWAARQTSLLGDPASSFASETGDPSAGHEGLP